MARFLDTNILLRYLTGDDEQKASAAYDLLLGVERGEEVVVTSDLVIAETVFTLQSPRGYRLSRELIRERLEPIIGLRGLRLPNKSLYNRVFDLYCKQRISFVDAYNAAYMEVRGLNEIYSYYTDFDRIEDSLGWSRRDSLRLQVPRNYGETIKERNLLNRF